MAILNYTNNVSVNDPDPTIVGEGTAGVAVTPEVTLFIDKFSHVEDENITGGDAIGFTIVFGNYSDFPYVAEAGAEATLEDVLTIADPIILRLASLSICDNYQLWVVAVDGPDLDVPFQLEEDAILEPGTYTLQLRKLVNGEYTEFFNIPSNSIKSISMLLEVTGSTNDQDPDDPEADPIDNGDFEEEPHETNNQIAEWEITRGGNGYAKTTAAVELTNSDPVRGFTESYEPVSGDYFALLKTGFPRRPTTISQTFTAQAGDTIEGSAFFFTKETTQTGVNPDFARVDILDKNNNLVSNVFSATANAAKQQFGSTDWVDWYYTFAQDGTYRIVGQVANVANKSEDSYLGLDAIFQNR